MNKKIMYALAGITLAVLLFAPGCSLEENDPIRNIPIVEPYISKQPQSNSINASAYQGVELSVEVSDWRGMDGNLSYQWYTFTTVDAYCADPVGGTPIPNATSTVYRPGLFVEAGRTYYFYVVVTNDFPDASDKTTTAIQSDLAIISFYDNTMAPAPIITKHPVGASYTIGRTLSVAPLEVAANSVQTTRPSGVVVGGTLTYQWFSNTTFSASGGTAIEGAVRSAYMPNMENLVKDDNFFYVEVTNTTAEGKSTIKCLPVNISMKPGIKAAAPRITVQPRNQTVFTTKTIEALSVKGETNDGGAITYQWYSADKAAATRGEGGAVKGRLIPDATGPSYVPAKYYKFPATPSASEDDDWETLTTATARSVYYYAEAINTNNDVTEDTTAITASKVVTVKITASAPGTSSDDANATIQLQDPRNPAQLFQYVRGYGGMDVAWANFPNTTEAETEFQYNPDWGLGYNILRIMIVPPRSNQGNYETHKDIIGGRDRSRADFNGWNGLIPSHRPDYIKNVKVVNKYNGYVLASPWTPPKEWKTNNSINSGGELIHAYYKSFANYLREFCQYMYYQDAPVYAVSIANEPNYAGGYDGCEWTPAQMRDFFIQEGQFTKGVRGWGGGKSIPRVLIVNGESANNPNINFAALDDPRSRDAIDFYARHVYGSQTSVLWGSQGGNQYASYKEDDPYQTECWMTEHNINSANALSFPNDSTWNYVWRFMNDVDLVIRLNNENAFVWWASKRFYSFIGDGSYGSGGEPHTGTGTPTVRGYGLSHYAKYSNETTRLNFSMSGTVTSSSGTTVPVRMGRTGSNVNDPAFSLDSLDAKITAFVTKDGTGAGADIKEFSLVMYTPTSTSGTGGYSLDKVEIKMPAGFKIDSAWGHRSARNSLFQEYAVEIGDDRTSAFVTVDRSQILSVRFVVSPKVE